MKGKKKMTGGIECSKEKERCCGGNLLRIILPSEG